VDPILILPTILPTILSPKEESMRHGNLNDELVVNLETTPEELLHKEETLFPTFSRS